jgi:hypothetical protein
MRDAMANDQDGKAAGKKKVAEKLTQFTQGKNTYRGELNGTYKKRCPTYERNVGYPLG